MNRAARRRSRPRSGSPSRARCSPRRRSRSSSRTAARSSSGRRASGKDGEDFELLKLRTMVVGAERKGAGYAVDAGDSRITRVGRLLRRTSIDELPQLWNVVRGEMSLIGPRPTLRYQVETYTERQRKRLDVRPGLTGWAQVNGRATLPWAERIELDVWYVEHRSPRVDLKILLRTPLALFGGTYRARRAAGRRTSSASRPRIEPCQECRTALVSWPDCAAAVTTPAWSVVRTPPCRTRRDPRAVLSPRRRRGRRRDRTSAGARLAAGLARGAGLSARRVHRRRPRTSAWALARRHVRRRSRVGSRPGAPRSREARSRRHRVPAARRARA